MTERLFIGTTPTGLVYCDRGREAAGDYLCIARLSFATLKLEVFEPRSHLLDAIRRDASKVQARKGEPYAISACGQTVTLGGGA